MSESSPGTITFAPATPGSTATMPAPVLLTVRQAAAMLGIGRSTAYALISSGDLEVVHIGRSVRVPADAIDDLVSRLRSESPEPGEDRR